VSGFLQRLECDDITFSATQAVDSVMFCGVQMQEGKQLFSVVKPNM
jgi:hypothetical protein